MESKRFETVASTKELVIEEGKSAIRIELQYGKDGQPTELVIAELYNKEGKWAYTRSQCRIPCTKDNAQHVLTCVQEMYKSSTKVEKKAKAKPSTGIDIDNMTDEQKAALLAVLLGKAKTEETPKTASKASKASEASELVFESTIINKRKIK